MDDYTPETPLRKCAKCNSEYPATPEYFYRQKCGKYGLGSLCKLCSKIATNDYKKSHPEKTKEYNRRGSLNYKARDPERYKAKAKRSKDKHKDKLRVQRKEHYQKNKTHINKVNNEYYLNHPEVAKAAIQRRKARKKNLPDTFTPEDWQRALDYFEGVCAICGRSPDLCHVIAMDHWIPLTSPDSLGTVAENIVPMCHSRKGGSNGCNNSKTNKHPLVWLTQSFSKRKANQIERRINKYFEWIKLQTNLP